MKFFYNSFFVILLVLTCCNPTKSEDKKEIENSKDLPGWELLWYDEFDSETLNTNLWKYETGGHGWGNNELQYYTDRTENAYLEDGKLVISANLENYEGSNYTSARINSKMGWKYKRIDVRAKLPIGVGTWPAIWMLPDVWDLGNGGWPENGEIDIMEHVGYDPGTVHATIHTADYNHSIGTQKAGSKFLSDAMSAFHVYTLEWYADSLKFMIDENEIFLYEKESDDYRKWPYNREFHLIMNLAIGGGWGGVEGVDDTIFPAKFEIDYVRVYSPAKN